jgi:hypothetical protein
MRRLRISFRVLILCGAAASLVACAQQDTVATFQTRTGAIALRLNQKGDYFAEITPHTVLPLEGYTSAHIESIWEAPSATLVVIAGGHSDCPLRYSLVVMKADGASITPIGDCGDTYNFTLGSSTFVIRQTGARDQRVWIFENGALQGPMLVTNRLQQRRPHAAPENPPNSAANPLLLPQISAPVGNEVIPPPVSSSGPKSPASNAPRD